MTSPSRHHRWWTCRPQSPRAALRPRSPGAFLHGRWFDFLTLGGGSLIFLGGLAAFYPRRPEALVALAAAMTFLAHFVNYPHFGHSYQIFYRGFIEKAFSPQSPMRLRYQIAGIAVPGAVMAFFGVALAKDDAALLGLAANVMYFTVGWHYAKQGFGILMVDAAHKRVQFAAGERRRLLYNAHLAWITSWLLANDELAKRDYWGITYLMFDSPDPLLAVMLAALAVSTSLVARDFVRRWRLERSLPANGLLAYIVSLYVWLPVGLVDIVLWLVVPFFHSLQYLSVVWRYQLNVERARDRAESDGGLSRLLRTPLAGFIRFVLAGVLLGVAGFWWAPEFLDAHGGVSKAVFGPTVFLFMAWTFINIHHYFLDTVIWRRENAEVRRHIFSVPPTSPAA